MKVRVLGDTSLVSSVVAEQTSHGFLHLLINTRERNPAFQVSGSLGHSFREFPEDESPPAHKVVVIYDTAEDSDDGGSPRGAEVLLIAEDDTEKLLLEGIAYEAQCKDQVEVLFLPFGLWKTSQLALWP